MWIVRPPSYQRCRFNQRHRSRVQACPFRSSAPLSENDSLTFFREWDTPGILARDLNKAMALAAEWLDPGVVVKSDRPFTSVIWMVDFWRGHWDSLSPVTKEGNEASKLWLDVHKRLAYEFAEVVVRSLGLSERVCTWPVHSGDWLEVFDNSHREWMANVSVQIGAGAERVVVVLLTHPTQAPNSLVSHHAKRAIREFHERAVPADAFTKELNFDDASAEQLELEELEKYAKKVERYRRFFNDRVENVHAWDNPLFILPILPTGERNRDPTDEW